MIAISVGSDAVVAGVDAGVVRRAVDANPVGAVDAAVIAAGGAIGESAGDLDPSVLLGGDHSNFRRRFGQILVLTEHQGDVLLVAMGHADDVQGNADFNTLLLRGKECVRCSVRKFHRLVAIAK